METKKIAGLFTALYDGKPWLEVTLAETLRNISAEKAFRRPLSGGNSIWEITNHIIDWRMNVLRRIKGEIVKTPEHNYFLPVIDGSDDAWNETRYALAATQREWEKFLSDFNDGDLDGIYPANGQTHFQHMHGIIQHDAYHLGQIVLLAKHG